MHLPASWCEALRTRRTLREPSAYLSFVMQRLAYVVYLHGGTSFIFTPRTRVSSSGTVMKLGQTIQAMKGNPAEFGELTDENFSV